MEIGTLNQRITFLVNRVVTDEIGNHTAVWSCKRGAEAGISGSSESCLAEHQQHQFSYSLQKQHLQCHRNYSFIRPQQLHENRG